MEVTSLPPRVQEWHRWMLAGNHAPRTIEARMLLMRRLVQETRADPERLAADQIIDWLAAHPRWSAGTRRTYHANLSAWFDWLVRMGHRMDDPMMLLRAPRLPRYEARPVADEHMPRLLAQRMHARTRVMIMLAALAGLRVHEIAKMRGEDVDPLARTLSVRGKGGSVRRLPLADPLVEIAAQMPRRGWWFPSRSPEGHVQARSVSAMIGQVMRRAEVPGTAHSLRHWFATTLVDEDVDIRTVQELLRHASLATTQIYTRVSDERRRDAVSRLDVLRAARGPAA